MCSCSQPSLFIPLIFTMLYIVLLLLSINYFGKNYKTLILIPSTVLVGLIVFGISSSTDCCSMSEPDVMLGIRVLFINTLIPIVIKLALYIYDELKTKHRHSYHMTCKGCGEKKK